MSSVKNPCARCGKNVMSMEEVKAAGKSWHKPGTPGTSCFRCKQCNVVLTLANHKAAQGEIYCNAHVPSHKAATVKDSVAMKTALNAPKKVSEGTGVAQKGDSKINAARAANAPPASAKTGEAAAASTPKTPTAGETAPTDAGAPAPDAGAAPTEHQPVADAPPTDAPPADAPPADAPPADAPPADAPAHDAVPAPQ